MTCVKMNFSIPTISLPGCSLIPLQPVHAEILHRIYQVEDVLRYFPSTTPPPLERVERFILEQQKHWEQYHCGNWAILPDHGKEMIGWAGLQYLPELDEIEVGFLLAKPFWGKGYATAAAQASLQYGFNHLKLEKIIALVHPQNFASQRVLGKCGLTCQETIHLWGIDLIRYQIKNTFDGNRIHIQEE